MSLLRRDLTDGWTQMLDDQLEITETPSTARLGLYWGPVLAYGVLIFYLSSFSHPEDYAPALLKQISDKVAHVVEYAIFGILCYRAFQYAAGARAARSAVFLAIVAATFYGMTDELHQVFVPFRQPDGWDLLMDSLGSASGAWGWHWTIGRSDEADTVM